MQRGLTGRHETLERVHGHAGDIQECGWAGLRASALSPSHRVGLLTSEASYTINRDKLNCSASKSWSSSESFAGRPGLIFHIPTDFVVAQEAADVESSSCLAFLWLHNLKRRFIA